MTRKDYNLIAAVLKQHTSGDVRELLATEFYKALKADNAAFQGAKWFKALEIDQ